MSDAVIPVKEPADPWAAGLSEQAKAGASTEKSAAGANKIGFAPLKEGAMPVSGGSGAQDGAINLDVVLDVPVTLSLELGRTRMSIRQLMQLNQGSVVELDRLVSEPLDVLVNGALIARGEVVVINETYGIRLTEVISPAERVRRLR